MPVSVVAKHLMYECGGKILCLRCANRMDEKGNELKRVTLKHFNGFCFTDKATERCKTDVATRNNVLFRAIDFRNAG